jgi:selenocysteine lyase/cysteine desulfurase
MLGLGVAVDYALGWGLDPIAERVTALSEAMRRGLGAIPGVGIHDPGQQCAGIVTFTVPGMDSGQVKEQLAGQRIHVWTSSGDSARLDFDKRGLVSVVRASPHYYNSEAEVEQLVEAVSRVAE